MEEGNQARFRGLLEGFNARQGLAYDLLRVFIGLALFIRGMLFIVEPGSVAAMADQGSTHWFWTMALGHYVAAAHICGGALLAAGLFTRLAALVQLPSLVGAVFFVHLSDGLLAANQSLELSVLVLIVLCMYTVFGGGKWSLDEVFMRAPSKGSGAADHPPGAARNEPV